MTTRLGPTHLDQSLVLAMLARLLAGKAGWFEIGVLLDMMFELLDTEEDATGERYDSFMSALYQTQVDDAGFFIGLNLRKAALENKEPDKVVRILFAGLLAQHLLDTRSSEELGLTGEADWTDVAMVFQNVYASLNETPELAAQHAMEWTLNYLYAEESRVGGFTDTEAELWRK